METASEKSKTSGWKSCLLETGLYLAVFLLTLLLFLLFKPAAGNSSVGIGAGAVAQSLQAIGLAACLAVGGYLLAVKKLTCKRAVLLLLAIGYIVRVGYMLYTPASVRQHDTYTPNFDGHEAYAFTIFETGGLPTSNVYQFYHPPLNAAVQAAFMHFTQSLFGGLSRLYPQGEAFLSLFTYGKPNYIDETRWFLYSSCQILALLYSFIACVVSLKILKLFNFPEATKILLAAFVILFPRGIQFSGMLNNDALAFTLALCALYFALKWQKQGKKLTDILLCGLFVGLGMSAKISIATVCLPIAGVFIVAFIETLRKKENALSVPKSLLQYGLFLLVCAPVGLWFQVYAKIRFDQAFGHVFSNLNHKLYTGDHSFFSRFILCFDFSEYFGTLWCRPFEGNYYLFNYALRSAVFGEFSYPQGEGFGVLAVLTAYITVILLAVALGYSAFQILRKKRRGKDECLPNPDLKTRAKTALGGWKDLLFAFLLLQSQVIGEIYFYIKMPYGCTMDFRYIMPIILGIGLTLGYAQKALVAVGTAGAERLNRLLSLSIIIFLISSTLFYCVCV